MAHKLAWWLHNPCRLGVPTALDSCGASEVAHKWAWWLHNTCRFAGFHRFRAGGQNERWPTCGSRCLHNPCRLGGPHRFIGKKQKLPTSGLGGYITPAASRVPTASELGVE